MITAAYPKAATPEPFQILGLVLKPFSLGHYERMMLLDVAFVADEPRIPTLIDLVSSVLICAHTYEEFFPLMENDEFVSMIKEWGAKCGEFDFVEKVELFRRYMAEGSKQPVVIYDGEGKSSGAHWTQAIKLALMEKGYDESRVLNMPLTQAFADFYRIAELNGVLSLARPDQIADMERAVGHA